MTKQETADLERRLADLRAKQVQLLQAYTATTAQIQLLEEILGVGPKEGDE